MPPPTNPPPLSFSEQRLSDTFRLAEYSNAPEMTRNDGMTLYDATNPNPTIRRLDEIGTEERLPLPEWEWELSESTQMGGPVGLPREGSDGVGGSSRAGDSATRSERPSVNVGGVRVVSVARHVHARVSAEGRTRVLLISSHKDIRRTISTFYAKDAAFVRQEWQGRLVLEKYRRCVRVPSTLVLVFVRLLLLSGLVLDSPQLKRRINLFNT